MSLLSWLSFIIKRNDYYLQGFFVRFQGYAAISYVRFLLLLAFD